MHENQEIDYQQIYIAGNTTIKLIERIETRFTGKPVFTEMQPVFTHPPEVVVEKIAGYENSISIGNNNNYMVFKEASDPRVHIVASCSPFQYFNNITFTCDACDNSTRTWGVQGQECMPCLDLRKDSFYQGPFKEEMFKKLCRDEGFIKSILLVTILPVITVIGSLLFCVIWANKYGKEGHRKSRENRDGIKKVEDRINKMLKKERETMEKELETKNQPDT